MHAARNPRKATFPTSPGSGPGSSGAAPAAILALVVANVALAFGPLFVRLADVGPVTAAFWRMALAVPPIALGAWLLSGRPRALPSLPRRSWWLLGIAGVAFASDLGSWHIGILGTTLANATLFGNCAIFIFPLYGFLAARRWPSRRQGIALLLAGAGAALLMGRSYQADPAHLVGDLMCLFAGVLYAGYFVLMADLRRSVAPMPALALSSAASLGPLLAFALLLGEQRVMPGDWTPLIVMALVSQLLGQGCMIYALGKLSPLVIGLALLIQPVVAATTGWLMFDERLGVPDFVGVVMVAVALVLVRRDPDPATDTR